MMDSEVPYFITNEDWYYYDEDDEMYKLTDKATNEAIKSYNEYYGNDDTDLDE